MTIDRNTYLDACIAFCEALGLDHDNVTGLLVSTDGFSVVGPKGTECHLFLPPEEATA